MRSTTVLVLDLDAPAQLLQLSGDRRRRSSLGTQVLTRHSPVHPDSFLLDALALDLSVTECLPQPEGDHVLHTCGIDRASIRRALALLESALADAERLAERLAALSPSESAARVIAAFRAGEATEQAGPAEEAAAFAMQLVESVRVAGRYQTSVCWEHRDPQPA
jgi:hypothetical protein